MKALVIGATGYVGSAVGRNFKAHGHETHGLARNAESASRLEAAGLTPAAGALEDLAGLGVMSARYDVVIFAPAVDFEAERAMVRALLDGCRGTPARIIYTSGTGVIGIESRDGRWSDHVFAEDDPFPFPGLYPRTARLATEEMVRRSADEDVHAMVMRPPLIWGHGGSVQVPAIFESARRTGQACYVGLGLNLYSNVHVDDLAEAYRLAAERGAPGALYHTVSGEANFRAIAEAAAEVMGCGTRSVGFDEACEIWSARVAVNALAVNSRSEPRRTRDELGWEPEHLDMIEDIRHGSYRARYLASTARD